MEVDGQGRVIDDVVSFQFDPDLDDTPTGTLIFLLTGTTLVGVTRHFRLYFNGAEAANSSARVPELVTLTENAADEGQDSFKIVTQNATYFYHKYGAGFSSMIDRDGNDWLSYRPGGGSAGEYRGIPNMGHPEGYCHPGNTISNSRIVGWGPLRVSIRSESNDGKMVCRWDIFPHYARMTLLKMRTPYWFLYEGTPGGKLDEANDYCVRSSGEHTSLAQKWDGPLPDPEWLYFGAGNTDRVLYLVHHEADQAIDSYWPMEGNMTVFGFGRLGLNKYMERVPAQFTIGFAERGDFAAASGVIEAAYRDLDVRVGEAIWT